MNTHVGLLCLLVNESFCYEIFPFYLIFITFMEVPDHLTCLLRNLYAGQEQQLELDIEQWTGSKLGKEYVKALFCHPAYLTYMQTHHVKFWTR